jgi:2'-5' RNA ligase
MDRAASKSLRLFYALWPDETVRTALTALQAPLQGRLTRPANLHLTLAFLGSQPASVLPTLQEILRGVPGSEMTLVLDRVDYFSRQRIAWAGLQHVPAPLTALHAGLNALLVRHHIGFDQHSAFKPHLTLARDAAPPPDSPCEPVLWQANQVALVQSVNEDGGVCYRVLASRCLNGRAAS